MLRREAWRHASQTEAFSQAKAKADTQFGAEDFEKGRRGQGHSLYVLQKYRKLLILIKG